jgi:antitoxin HicB
MSQGDTPEEALAMIRDALEGWLSVALEDGASIPEPRSLEDYSGRFVVRVPASLHCDLVERAAAEGVSLNQFINVALARAVAPPSPVPYNAHVADLIPVGARDQDPASDYSTDKA